MYSGNQLSLLATQAKITYAINAINKSIPIHVKVFITNKEKSLVPAKLHI